MTVYILRCNGALVDIFTTEEAAVVEMKKLRKNGEFWRITPHKVRT